MASISVSSSRVGAAPRSRLRASRPGPRGWWRRRRLRFVLRHVGDLRGARVLDVGGGWGLFANLLVLKGAERVTVLELRAQRCEGGRRLQADRPIEFVRADVFDRLDLVPEHDTVCALRCLHQMGPRVCELFQAIQNSNVRRVIVQGVVSERAQIETRHVEEIWGPYLGVEEGIVELLRKHGFQVQLHPHRRYPVAVGSR